MDYTSESLRLHGEWKGKIEVVSRVEVKDKKALSLAYTPGVAGPCLEINKDVSRSYDLTRRWNTVAVITDGSAVLGLGDIGPEAGMPVMEGKCVLFKEFGGVDAIPICVKTKDTEKFVDTVSLISGSFGGINLEDISAPRCFEIERRLKEKTDIPIFHDDQHGTAVVCAAALINALRFCGKRIEDCTAVFNGAGAAGVAIAKLFLSMGIRDVIMCDRKGVIHKNREGIEKDCTKLEIASFSNKSGKTGTLADVLRGADIFIGVSAPDCVNGDMIRSMAEKPIVFPMANPVPEIMPDEALSAGAFVVGTGRSDFPNQINNVLAFPGIFRGALDVRASDINEEMKMAAAGAIASLVADDELRSDYIIPAPFDNRVGEAVASAVSAAARKSGVARV